MVKYLNLFIVGFLIISSSLGVEAGEHQAPPKTLNFDNIKKISDTSYEGTLQARPHLKFIMEKANEHTLMGVSDQSGRNLGNDYFRRVLKDLSSRYDVWVAYVQDSHATQKNSSNIHIMMTVTTTSEALLTSHMGIFKTPRSQEKSLSIPLHAFAAKVSLMRDPKKKYMVTAPLENMLKIMVAKLPSDSLFLGSKESVQDIPVRKQKIMKKIKKGLQKKDAHTPMDQQVLEEHLQKDLSFTESFRDDLSLKEYDEFSKKFRPLISRPRPFSLGKIVIFKETNPEEPWLEISSRDYYYGWLFTGLFDGIGSPETVVINLEKLAALYGS